MTLIVPDRPQACGPGYDAVHAGLCEKDAWDLTLSDLLTSDVFLLNVSHYGV